MRILPQTFFFYPIRVMALKKMIHRQAGIDPVIQELFYENLPYSPRELIPASKLPNTTVGQIAFHSYSTCMHK